MQAVQYRCFDSKRFFGVELEVSNTKTQEVISNIIKKETSRGVSVTGYGQTFRNSYWHIKTDSTCGPLGHGKDKGFEVASYIASGACEIEDIGTIAQALATGGIEVNNNCGMHVHVNIADFSPTEAGVLLGRWIKIEPWIRQAVPKHRKNNKYAKFLFKARAHRFNPLQSYDPLDFWNLIKPTDFSVYENRQKRVALNMINYAATKTDPWARATAEFRFPEGTLSKQDVCNWVRLFILFVESSQKASMPPNLLPAKNLDEVMEILGLTSTKSFYILDQDLYDLKIWFLNRLIQFGQRKYMQSAKKMKEFCVLND